MVHTLHQYHYTTGRCTDTVLFMVCQFLEMQQETLTHIFLLQLATGDSQCTKERVLQLQWLATLVNIGNILRRLKS